MEAMQGLNEHEIDRIIEDFLLHYVLLRLPKEYEGLELLFVAFMRKCTVTAGRANVYANPLVERLGSRKWKEYLGSSKRPMAIMLLVKELNDSNYMAEHLHWMHHLISKALPGKESYFQQLTPLRMLQDLSRGFAK